MRLRTPLPVLFKQGLIHKAIPFLFWLSKFSLCWKGESEHSGDWGGNIWKVEGNDWLQEYRDLVLQSLAQYWEITGFLISICLITERKDRKEEFWFFYVTYKLAVFEYQQKLMAFRMTKCLSVKIGYFNLYIINYFHNRVINFNLLSSGLTLTWY